ncbi:hypothetical protein Fcan01_24525 [Folsomia candida]|uniref:F-box domain-containing protein n=1 Tax=Folsomia candida TaxID=158441 RepID=A0A226D646_FOLCA|nr:hypothetical protein Fcan01_24525 [Folsomia candida]
MVTLILTSEVIAPICGQLCPGDVKNCRLVSKMWAARAAPILKQKTTTYFVPNFEDQKTRFCKEMNLFGNLRHVTIRLWSNGYYESPQQCFVSCGFAAFLALQSKKCKKRKVQEMQETRRHLATCPMNYSGGKEFLADLRFLRLGRQNPFVNRRRAAGFVGSHGCWNVSPNLLTFKLFATLPAREPDWNFVVFRMDVARTSCVRNVYETLQGISKMCS